MSPVLVSPHIQKSTKVLHGDVGSLGLAVTVMRLAETFGKNMCSHTQMRRLSHREVK